MKLFRKSFEKIIANDTLAIIDSNFPQELPFGFRNYEINGLLDKIEGAEAFSMYPMEPGNKAWFHHKYGINENIFNKNKKSYLKFNPQNVDKIHWINPNNRYQFRLSYSYFLAETYTLLPFYNKHQIPFVFVLYPGGGFGLDNKSSDAMLYEIFTNPNFRGVITTQDATREYILRKNLCPAYKIHFLFGGYTQWTASEALPKQFYPKDKQTFDICFVAEKYSELGIDKGYDLFIEAAHLLIPKYPDMRFHVVGGFRNTDIDVSTLNIKDEEDKIIFYGRKTPDSLKELYTNMDICLSPNRPGKLFAGNFDGFPLCLDAMALNTALFTTDELHNNNGRYDDDEIVVIKPEISDIITKIEYYYNNIHSLYCLSKKGQIKTNLILNPQKRLESVINILTNIA